MNSVFTHSGRNLAWLIPLRLVSFCLIFGTLVLWLGFPSFLHVPFLSYAFFTLAVMVMLLVARWRDYPVVFRFLVALHFITEIVTEAGIVYSTGSLHSPFSALFLLTIVSTALVYRLVGTLLIATIVSFAYAAVMWVNVTLPAHGGISPRGIFGTDDTLFYSTFLHFLIFYLVAFISGFLAEKLQSKDAALHSTSAELKKARLDTGDILWHLNSGVVTIDRQGEIVYFNRAAESILGLQEIAVSGRKCRDVFTGQLASLGTILIDDMDCRRQLTRTEFDIIHDDGRRIPIGLSASTLYDENFDARGVIAIFQDLTEAKALEKKMRQADRMAAVGELSACIAHEIRNPLAAISGSVEVLKQDLVVDGDNRRLMSLIVKETARLNHILSDFLLYARVGRPEFRKVELNALISDVVELIRRHPAFHERMTIDLRSRRHITYVSGDDDKIRQLLLNLLVNACEACEGGPGTISIDIETKKPDAAAGVCLIVADNGPGIPAEQMASIFLPFHSTKKGGTGLGLAIVSRLMEALGGRVEVESEPGVGTRFRLYFRSLGQENQPVGSPPALQPTGWAQ